MNDLINDGPVDDALSAPASPMVCSLSQLHPRTTV